MARLDINAIRRRQIIDAAVAVMAEKGWAETSIDEATRRAEVSRGLVSYHFKDKADLLSGVLARCQEIFNESVAQAQEEGQNPVETMRAVTRIGIELAKVNPVPYEVFVQFTASAKRDPRLGDEVRAHIGAVTGVALQWLLEPGAFDFEETERQTVDMLMGYLVAEGVDPVTGAATPVVASLDG
jgi:AcrR family transcriptional regulator